MLAIDVSKHNVSPAEMFPGPADAVIVRSSYSGVVDPTYTVFRMAAKRANKPASSYFFLEYAWNPPHPSTQAAVADSVAFRGDVIAVDFERPNRRWPDLPPRARCLRMLEDAFSVLATAGRQYLLYTNVATLYHLLPLPEFLLGVPLWVASYPYRNGQASNGYCESADDIPPGFSPETYGMRLAGWQFTPRGPGAQYGVGSAAVDLSIVMDPSAFGFDTATVDGGDGGDDDTPASIGIVSVTDPRWQRTRRRLHVRPSVYSRTSAYVMPGDIVRVFDVREAAGEVYALVANVNDFSAGWLTLKVNGRTVAKIT